MLASEGSDSHINTWSLFLSHDWCHSTRVIQTMEQKNTLRAETPFFETAGEQ